MTRLIDLAAGFKVRLAICAVLLVVLSATVPGLLHLQPASITENIG